MRRCIRALDSFWNKALVYPDIKDLRYSEGRFLSLGKRLFPAHPWECAYPKHAPDLLHPQQAVYVTKLSLGTHTTADSPGHCGPIAFFLYVKST